MPARVCSRTLASIGFMLSLVQASSPALADEVGPPPPPELGPGYTWALKGEMCAGQWIDELDGKCAHVDPAPLVPVIDTPEYTPDYLRSVYPSLASLDPTGDDFLDLAAKTKPIYCQDTNVFHGIYIRKQGEADRYDGIVVSLRDKLATLDSYVFASAQQRGANIHLRYACNADNNIRVAKGGAIPTSTLGFGSIKNILGDRGYNLPTEKYIVFADWSSENCGVADYLDDESPGQTNINNTGNDFGLIWLGTEGCPWGHAAAAMHEIGHQLGAVQEQVGYNNLNEFNGDGDRHPKDYYDVMANGYEGYPRAYKRCTNINQRKRFDCKKDDYFHPAPKAGSYLATHWNIANSKFLLRAAAAPGAATLSDDPCGNVVTSWSGWEGHAGAIAGGLDAASWAPGRLDVFSRSADNKLLHKYWAGAGWSNWLDEQPGPVTPFGDGIRSDPSAVSWGPDRIDIFARGADNALWTTAWNGSGWTGWHSLGAPLAIPELGNLPVGITSAPDAGSRSSGYINVVARGPDNKLWHIFYDNGVGGWSGWGSLGQGEIASDPSITSWDANRYDVFATGTDGALWRKWWNGSAWFSGWEVHSGLQGSGPDATSTASNRLNIVAMGGDQLYEKTWNGSAWSEWTGIGGQASADPGIVSWDANRLDLFVRGTDGLMYHRWWPVVACAAEPPD